MEVCLSTHKPALFSVYTLVLFSYIQLTKGTLCHVDFLTTFGGVTKTLQSKQRGRHPSLGA